ncbi:quinone oxidoreductase family protein [Altererythrobacter sp. GH1-8]|uniref:quinone oxidoreductase family protein n=1 Tax=Altererythrobacter sp. GH1-8 TaxID=3349333 RepID=UPI00374D1605
MTEAKAIVVHQHGGSDAMSYETVQLDAPSGSEVLLRQTAIGVNFIDCYHRSGLYPVPVPLTPGMEGIGFIEAVGPDVTLFEPGQRVCYGNGPLGGYASKRLIPEANLVAVPDGLDDNKIGGTILRGLTAWYLVARMRPLEPGTTVLFHAAAGGVGTIFCQWAKAIGLKVIGTVGSEAKAEIARASGCEHVLVAPGDNLASEVRKLTNGAGVPVVFDGVGKDTFEQSLDCLSPTGLMVSFGNASGPPPAIEIGSLGPKGSLFVTRPTLMHYTAKRADLEEAMSAYLGMVAGGQIKNEVGQSYALADAAQAHDDLEGRKTTGTTMLVP